MSSLPSFHSALLAWGSTHQRTYPWRETREPYHVLIAEVLLHRTRADQVEPLYRSFTQKYPTLPDAARASADDLYRMLAPAGLRWRIDALRRCVHQIIEQYGGAVPETRAELEALPGIGHYIASAVRCFAFGHPDAVVDTNTVRIASRLFGFPVTDSSRRNSAVHAAVKRLVDPAAPRESNFALLDLGALVCTPREPACSACPVLAFCITGRQRIAGATE